MPKTFRDIKTIRSVRVKCGPIKDASRFLELHGLAKEKQRLEKEGEIWQVKVNQAKKRVREIEVQMRAIEKTDGITKIKQETFGPSSKWKEMDISY